MRGTNYWLRKDRLSRRRFIGTAGAVGAGAAGLALVGCGDDDDLSGDGGDGGDSDQTPEPTATVEPVSDIDPDGTLTMSITADRGSLDIQEVGGVSNYYNGFLHFGHLLEVHPVTRDFVPHMAEVNWEEGNEALLIKLHDGIKTHHGTTYTADDLAFSIGRVAEQGDYADRDDWTSGRAQFFTEIGTPEVVDGLNLRLPVTAQNVAIPGAAFPITYMVDKTYIEEVGDQEFSVNPSGFGPYKFVSRDPDNRIESTRFDDFYWDRTNEYGPWTPSYKNLVQLVRPEPLSVVAALEAGEIDFATEMAPDLAAQFEDDDDFTVEYFSNGLGHAIQFNTSLQTMPNGEPNPFLDLRVRQAANMAINREAYIDNLLTGREEPMFGLSKLSLGYPGKAVEQYYFGFDPEAAKALMAEAGYEDGFDVPLFLGTGYYPQSDQIVLIVQQELAEIGIRTELTTMPFADYLPVIRNKDTWGMHYFGSSGTAEVQSNATAFWADDGFYNQSPIPDSRTDELYRLQSAEFDAERRKEILEEAWIEHYTQATWLFLHQVTQISVYNNKKVRWAPDGGDAAVKIGPAPWEFDVLAT